MKNKSNYEFLLKDLTKLNGVWKKTAEILNKLHLPKIKVVKKRINVVQIHLCTTTSKVPINEMY